MFCPGPGEGSFLSNIPIYHPDGAFLPWAQPCADQCCGCLGVGSLSLAALWLTPCPLSVAGHCQGDGYRIGFGQCAGKVLPALSVA